MALTDEEKSQLAALQQKADEPDEDDYDVEIWDETGAGAKVPYRKAKGFLGRFGIDIEPPPSETSDDGKGEGKPANGKTARASHPQKYFGKPK